MDVEEVDLSMCESELSAAYDGDVSLVESSVSVEISVSESETDVDTKLIQGGSPNTSRSLYSTPRSLLHGVKKPRSSVAGRSDLRKQVFHARMQAELIRANSKIVQLESELSRQWNLTEHAQIQQTDSYVSSISDTTNGAQVERLHQVGLCVIIEFEIVNGCVFGWSLISMTYLLCSFRSRSLLCIYVSHFSIHTCTYICNSKTICYTLAV